MSNSILGSEATKGKVISFNGKLCRIMSSQSVKPGKGGTYNQVVMKDIYSGTKIETRFRSDEHIDLVQIFKEKGFFVNFEGEDAYFINSETLDSFIINKEVIENYEFLEENLEVDLLFTDNNEFIGVNLPKEMKVKVIDAPFYSKGQTETPKDIVVTLSNGAKIKTPSYVKAGDMIIVKLIDEPYFSSRA